MTRTTDPHRPAFFVGVHTLGFETAATVRPLGVGDVLAHYDGVTLTEALEDLAPEIQRMIVERCRQLGGDR